MECDRAIQRQRGTIYGIGGGPVADPRMAVHFADIVELCRRGEPESVPDTAPVTIAVLPTAQYNGLHPKFSRGPTEFIHAKFSELGCETREFLLGEPPPGMNESSPEEVAATLAACRGLYVLGGDTRHLLATVRARQLVPVFREALERGMVFSGSSAGFLWLSVAGMSDSESFHQTEWRYITVDGLGFLPVAVNVHDNGAMPVGLVPRVSRREQFEQWLAEFNDSLALAVDEFAAVLAVDGVCRAVGSSPDTGVSLLLRGADGAVERRPLSPGEEIDLYDKGIIGSIVAQRRE